jgi:hypothetical protein
MRKQVQKETATYHLIRKDPSGENVHCGAYNFRTGFLSRYDDAESVVGYLIRIGALDRKCLKADSITIDHDRGGIEIVIAGSRSAGRYRLELCD